jgi:integrase
MTQTFATLAAAFVSRREFRATAASTQIGWERELQWLTAGLGHLPLDELKPSIVQLRFDELSDRPGRQHVARTVLRLVEKWALKRELISRPLTTDLEIGTSDAGHDPWSDSQIALALSHHVPVHIRHLVALALNTGQRCSDLIRMRWDDLVTRQGRLGIQLTTQKVGVVLWVPFSKEFAAEILTWSRTDSCILTRADGRAWERAYQPSQAFAAERDKHPALAGLVMHGLRSTACVRLRRLGVSSALISRFIGLSEPMVTRYCRHASQEEDALAVVGYLDAS